MKTSPIDTLRSSAAVLALALPLLVGCGNGGNGAQSQNAAGDSVVEAILGSATETFIPSPPGSPRISPQERANQPLQIAEMGYNQGSPDAPLKVMEISDFGCGFCRRFHEDTYPTIKEIYVDSGLVEWKHLPFVLGMFPNGLEAAMVAECAGEQDQFFTMQDRLFKDQGGWKNTSAPLPFMVAAAEEEGLDAQRLDNCIKGSWREARVRANIRLGQEMGVTGTPTFLVDNRILPGALPLDSFRDVLDMILTEKGITPPVR